MMAMIMDEVRGWSLELQQSAFPFAHFFFFPHFLLCTSVLKSAF